MRGVRSKRCAICGARQVQGHHILRQQDLRRAAQALDLEFERLRWDDRNRLPLCEKCHGLHHARQRPVPLQVLIKHAPKVFQMARELELEESLRRQYADE